MKKSLQGCLLIVCLLSCLAVCYYVGKLPPAQIPAQENWVASSSVNAHDAHLAVDGDPATRWSTNTTMQPGMVFQLDIGRSRRIAGVSLNMGFSPYDFPRAYHVAVSVDSVTWQFADYHGSLSPDRLDIRFTPVPARYIKLVQRGTTFNDRSWSIHEIEVYQYRTWHNATVFRVLVVLLMLGGGGLLLFRYVYSMRFLPGQRVLACLQGAVSDPCLKSCVLFLALLLFSAWIAESVTSSGTVRIGNTAGWTATSNVNPLEAPFAIDGWQETAWTSGLTMLTGAFVELDLGTEQRVNAITLDLETWADLPIEYTLDISRDRKHWQPVLTGTSEFTTKVKAAFRPVTARFLRITQTGTPRFSHWWAINEFSVYRPAPANPLITWGILIVIGFVSGIGYIRQDLSTMLRAFLCCRRRHYPALLCIIAGGASLGFFLWMRSMPIADWESGGLWPVCLQNVSLLAGLGWRVLLYTTILMQVWILYASLAAAKQHVSVHHILYRDAYSYLPLILLTVYWRRFSLAVSLEQCALWLILITAAGVLGGKLLATRRVKLLHTPFIIPALVFMLFLAFYFFNLKHFSPLIFGPGYGIFSTDISEIIDDMRHLTFLGDMRKHLLFSAVTNPLVQTLQCIAPISQEHSILLVLSLIGAANILVVFLILCTYFYPTAISLWLSVAYAMLFANLVMFSVPETYSLSNLLLLVYVGALIRVKDRLSRQAGLLLSVIAGIAALCNPPLLSLLVIHVFLLWRSDSRRFFSVALANLATGVFVYGLPNILIHGWTFYVSYTTYTESYSSLAHLIDLKQIATVLSSFLVFAVISPLNVLKNQVTLADGAGYFHTPLATALLICYIGGLIYTFGHMIRKRDGFMIGIAGWMLIMIIFYTYFCPADAILFACQILFPLFLLFIVAFQKMTRKHTLLYYGLGLFSVLLAMRNILALYAPIQ